MRLAMRNLLIGLFVFHNNIFFDLLLLFFYPFFLFLAPFAFGGKNNFTLFIRLGYIMVLLLGLYGLLELWLENSLLLVSLYLLLLLLLLQYLLLENLLSCGCRGIIPYLPSLFALPC
jgi:hypothetical protein